MWTWSTGLGIAAASGHESATIRRAWVSGDPAGIESAAIRWRDLPRMARLGERQPGNQPAGLGEPTPVADISRDRRAWGHRGHWTRGTRGDPAELPRPLAVGYGGITSGDFLAVGQKQTDKTQEQNKNFQKRKQNEVKGRRLLFWSGLLSRCTHEGGTGTRRQGHKLK